MKVAALTCTGGRSRALKLCREWFGRQTRQPDLWVLVDDCDPQTATAHDFSDFEHAIIRPEPRWKRGGPHTLPRNMAEGLRFILENHPEIDAVVIFEDDDWYHPSYVSTMLHLMMQSRVPVVGECNTVYYNVALRTWRQNFHVNHASLCSCSFRRDVLEEVAAICEFHAKADCDHAIFRQLNPEKFVLADTNFCIGIKGIPDPRAGAGPAHKGSSPGLIPDPDMATLRAWIGDDVKHYEEFFSGYYPVSVLPKTRANRSPGKRPGKAAMEMHKSARQRQKMRAAALARKRGR